MVEAVHSIESNSGRTSPGHRSVGSSDQMRASEDGDHAYVLPELAVQIEL